MLGLILNTKKLIQVNGIKKLKPKLMELMMLLCKDLLLLFQITITE